jgi:hypothetical protein
VEEVGAGPVEACGVPPAAAGVAGDVGADLADQVGLRERDGQGLSGAPPGGFSVEFSMLTGKSPPAGSTDDRAAAFDGTRLFAERVGPGLRAPETSPFRYSVIPYSGTRYHAVPARAEEHPRWTT